MHLFIFGKQNLTPDSFYPATIKTLRFAIIFPGNDKNSLL
jgi:hypothetical protein